IPIWERVALTACARSSLESISVPSRSKISKSMSTRCPFSFCEDARRGLLVCGARAAECRPRRTPPFCAATYCDECRAASPRHTGCYGCARVRPGSCSFPGSRRPVAGRLHGRAGAPPARQICLSFLIFSPVWQFADRSEEHTSELQSPCNLVCRLLLEKK